MGRVIGLSLVGVLIVIVIGSWLLATPSDEYVLLPDDPHPADAVVSVGGVKPTSSRDGSGIYYLDVLVHRASLPESWLSRFEDGATVLPAEAVCRREEARATSTASTTSRSPTRARSRASSRCARSAQGHRRAHGRDVRRRRPWAPAYRAGLRPAW